MSKIFLVGDIHLGMGWPNSYTKWAKVHQDYFSEFLFPLLESKLSSGDIIVLLGDFFDNREVIPIDTLNYGKSVIERLSRLAPTHIIVGNHDLWTRSSSEINSVNIFGWIPNVSIYQKTSQIEYRDKKICMMPYIHHKEDQIEEIKKYRDSHYLFCHSDLNGCKMHLTSTAHRNSDKIDLDEFKSFDKVRSGHIHIRQETGIFKFVGSIFQMDRADMGDEKGIWIIDTDDDSEVFIPNTKSPVFEKVYLKNPEDVEDLPRLKDSKNWIDLYISNSLLINNRKLRRKLEILLETINFLSVSYIDDIQILEKLEGQTESGILDEEVIARAINLELEYTEVIKNYIEEQKWDSKKIKSGILAEFDEISRIYQDGFQKN